MDMKRESSIITCSKKDKGFMLIKGIALLGSIGFLFYYSWIAVLLGSPLLIFYYKSEYQKMLKRKTEELTNRFKDVLLAVLAALKAGYSVENAFMEAYRDLNYRFGSEDVMVKELLRMNRQIKNNIPIENLMEDFAKKSGADDIRDFAHIFRIAKKTGGDMGKIMERTISIITERVEIKEEIRMLIAGKRYEQKIMDLVPMGIIFYIRLSNPGYFDGLYHNPAGVVIMTSALSVYLAAYYLSEKILEIA
jgi:tight adherence protein B